MHLQLTPIDGKGVKKQEADDQIKSRRSALMIICPPSSSDNSPGGAMFSGDCVCCVTTCKNPAPIYDRDKNIHADPRGVKLKSFTLRRVPKKEKVVSCCGLAGKQ